MTGAGVLHAVRHPGAVTSVRALAWFAGARNAGTLSAAPAIGYFLAADRAGWFRCDIQETGGTDIRGPDGQCDLTGAFEVFATDGARQLRWRHDTDGAGPAIGLAEDPAGLPDGEPPDKGRQGERRRLAGTGNVARLLAGRVVTARDGWATLWTARYSPCDVPVTADAGDEVWARLAEYAVRDDHGNLTVIDTLLLGLEARPAGPTPGKERTQ